MSPSSTPPTPPRTIEDLMAQALAMEREAVARYAELADMMETHNNLEVAQLFRKMASYEALHVKQILADTGWSEGPAPSRQPGSWNAPEGPESVPIDEMHYLMHPWHALNLALAAELRAEAFFADMVQQAGDDEIRRAAEEMRAEEAEHVELVRAWMSKLGPPDPDWGVDPDPPRYED